MNVREDFRRKSESKVALFTLCTHYDDNKFVKRTFDNFTGSNLKSYSKKHGYDFYVFKDNSFFEYFNYENLESTSHKLEIIDKLFKKDYKFVFSIDSVDILITNKSKKLESFTDVNNSVFFSIDAFIYNFEEERRRIENGLFNINTGFFGLRKNDISKKFINDCINIVRKEGMEDYIHEQRLIEAYFANNPDFVQNHVSIGETLQQSFWIEQVNNWQDLKRQSERVDIWKKDDFLVHLSVLGDEANKYEVVKGFQKRYLD